MKSEFKLQNLKDKEDYADKVNKAASSIVTEVLGEEIDQDEDQEIVEFIDSDQSWDKAIDYLDSEWSKYETLDIAAVYDVIKKNYKSTVEHVEDNVDVFTGEDIVRNYRQFVLHCMAYDIAKTVDRKMENALSDDSKVVSV